MRFIETSVVFAANPFGVLTFILEGYIWKVAADRCRNKLQKRNPAS
jgi:hypothetical protein